MTVTVSVLDVGHGNATLVQSGDYTLLVDAPPGGVVDEVLESRNIAVVDDLVISHSDADHCGGAASLLTGGQVRVTRLHINPEPLRATHVYDDLIAAAVYAHKSHRVAIHPAIYAGPFRWAPADGGLEMEVLSPSPATLLGGGAEVRPGPRAAAAGSRKASSNSLSAVIRVVVGGVGRVLLTGDMDAAALEEVLEAGRDMTSEVVVFPHHGGLPGGSGVGAFSTRVVTSTGAETVVFSVGRDSPGFPRPETVTAVMSASPSPRVRCTQLARPCAASLPALPVAYQTEHPGAGVRLAQACAGTMTFRWDDAADLTAVAHPSVSDHDRFVGEHATTALCRAV